MSVDWSLRTKHFNIALISRRTHRSSLVTSAWSETISVDLEFVAEIRALGTTLSVPADQEHFLDHYRSFEGQSHQSLLESVGPG